MDLHLIATTFTALFLAELGDKTQLAVLSLTAPRRSTSGTEPADP